MRYLSLFAIVIASLGLFGLAFIMTQNRIKEIGVRKVNGATTFEIMTLFNKGFVILVIISFIIATPLIWQIMNRWLNNLAFKINLSWWIFVLTGIIAIVIALFTVSWQSWKAANCNPIKALRYE